MADALVSVIIPVFNGERFLAEALESVFAQDHQPLEVIVIDDGSTDASAEVARSFHDLVLIRQANAGPAAARNAGLARATGSFFAFLDADDEMAPGRLTAQLTFLRERPEVGCVLMLQHVLIEDGVTHPMYSQPGPPTDERTGAPPMTAMVRREAAELVGGFDPAYRVSHDTDWLFRLREAGVEIAILPLVGVIRRVHRRNLTHQVDVIRGDLVSSLRRRLERSRIEGNDEAT